MSKYSWYTFKSKSGHSYLYSSTKKTFIFISDKLKELLDLFKEKREISEFINEKRKNKDYESEEWLYNYNLFNLLKANGYFDDYNKNYFIDNRYTIDNYNIENCKMLCFELTQNCNLNCTYCTYGDLYENKRESKVKTLPFETAKLMIDYAKEKFGDKFIITIGFYGGEPLLKFELMRRIVEYSKKQFEKVQFQMTTNGLLLDKYMDYIIENKFKLSISLDGDDKNNIYRLDNKGVETFSKVINNIELLKIKWSEYFQTNVQILSVINSTSNINEILQFFYDKFQIGTYFSNLSQIGVKKPKLDDFDKLSKDYYKFFKEYSYKKHSNKKFKQTLPSEEDLFETLRAYSGNFYENHTEIFLNKKSSRRITRTCMPFERIFITTNGKILPCERINQNFHVGEIKNGKVILEPQHVIEKFNDHFDRISESCKNCYIIEKCHICVFHCYSNDETSACNYIINKSEFISILSKDLSYLEEHPELYNKMSKKDYYVN